MPISNEGLEDIANLVSFFNENRRNLWFKLFFPSKLAEFLKQRPLSKESIVNTYNSYYTWLHVFFGRYHAIKTFDAYIKNDSIKTSNINPDSSSESQGLAKVLEFFDINAQSHPGKNIVNLEKNNLQLIVEIINCAGESQKKNICPILIEIANNPKKASILPIFHFLVSQDNKSLPTLKSLRMAFFKLSEDEIGNFTSKISNRGENSSKSLYFDILIYLINLDAKINNQSFKPKIRIKPNSSTSDSSTYSNSTENLGKTSLPIHEIEQEHQNELVNLEVTNSAQRIDSENNNLSNYMSQSNLLPSLSVLQESCQSFFSGAGQDRTKLCEALNQEFTILKFKLEDIGTKNIQSDLNVLNDAQLEDLLLCFKILNLDGNTQIRNTENVMRAIEEVKMHKLFIDLGYGLQDFNGLIGPIFSKLIADKDRASAKQTFSAYLDKSFFRFTFVKSLFEKDSSCKEPISKNPVNYRLSDGNKKH